VNARDLEAAAATVRSRRRVVLRGLACTGAIVLAAIAVAPLSPRLAIALGVGALCQAAITFGTWHARRELIERLALEPAAYGIPEVARFGSSVAAPSELRRLAGWIQSLLNEPQAPLEMHLTVRARRYARHLDEIARDFAAPSARVAPASAVACRRLLTRPVQSPLYNPNLPEEDLTALLLRIRAGILTPADSR
jgi:hypothetical protein